MRVTTVQSHSTMAISLKQPGSKAQTIRTWSVSSDGCEKNTAALVNQVGEGERRLPGHHIAVESLGRAPVVCANQPDVTLEHTPPWRRFQADLRRCRKPWACGNPSSCLSCRRTA